MSKALDSRQSTPHGDVQQAGSEQQPKCRQAKTAVKFAVAPVLGTLDGPALHAVDLLIGALQRLAVAGVEIRSARDAGHFLHALLPGGPVGGIDVWPRSEEHTS